MTTKTDYNVGDINSTQKGSGARANNGKISFAITPLPLLAGCARVWMSGLLKYAPWNWAKGMQWSVPFDCLCRHLFKWWYLGEDIDSESGEHHLDLVLCNLFMLKHYTKTYPEGDDRPPEYADFASWLDDFNTPFDEAAYLERNPDIAKIIAERKDKVDNIKQPKTIVDYTRETYQEACVQKKAKGDRYLSQADIDRVWVEARQRYEEEQKAKEEPIGDKVIRLWGEEWENNSWSKDRLPDPIMKAPPYRSPVLQYLSSINVGATLNFEVSNAESTQ